MSAVATREGAIRVCASCGQAMTHVGADGECMRCLVSFGFLSDEQQSEGTKPDKPVRPGPLRYAHFEVEVNADGYPKILGSGAMAVTYCARDTILNSTVALKVITWKLAADPTARARFLREARAAAQIQHPNVARVIHYGEQDGECFYAMELVRGETLEERVQRDGPLPLSLALEVVEQTARGLAAGEACGVIHRDLKPSNLMTESDPSGQILVKIIDYGVAKVMVSDPTLQTQAGFIGTPAFASPEQFNDLGQQQVDTRSDIYSLGVVFWYLLTGRTPFAGQSLQEVRAKQSGELPLVQLKAAHVPAQVLSLLRAMLAVDPKKRPQSARELLTLVHRSFVRFEPGARSRRKQFLIGFAVLGLVIAIVTLAIFGYQRAQSSSQLDRAIAVLPFENLSPNADDRFFVVGIQDEILTKLASLADLKVIARTSTEAYQSKPVDVRTVGRQLNVGRVLEGSLQRSADKIRLNVQLIDTRTNSHLWAHSYDRKLDDVFTVQSEIAKTIAEQLEAKISPNEKKAIERSPTTDLTAFDLYTRANTLMLSYYGDVRAKYLEAIDLLNQAVARDPSFFLAYCQLAHAHDTLYFFGYDHAADRLTAAEAAVQEAFRLRPDAGEAHLARAENLYQGHLDYPGALAELAIARQLLPNHPRVFELTAYIANRQGKNEEWMSNLKRAVELDPRNSFLLYQLSESLLYTRRYEQAATAADSAVAMEPDDVEMKVLRGIIEFTWKADTRLLHHALDSAGENVPGGWMMLMCALAERDAAAANRALTKSGERTWGFDAIQFSRSFGAGLIARMTKDEAKANSAFLRARAEQEKIVESQPNYGPALCVLALIDAGLGRKEEALREGRLAIELMPAEKEQVNGAHILELFAVIAAWVGEKDLACEQLALALQYPIALGYGQLKLLPFWDPLRGDPCFEKIVASLAPKD
jgi:TolB-like protein/Tfp pilus assembly protein PilF/predicted Ser/Thr protein kinase